MLVTCIYYNNFIPRDSIFYTKRLFNKLVKGCMYITYLWDFNVYDCNNKNICKPRRGQIICQPADQHFDWHCNIYPTFKLHLSQLVQSQFRSIYRIVNQLKIYLSAERLPNNYPFLYPVLPNFLSRIVIYLRKKLK